MRKALLAAIVVALAVVGAAQARPSEHGNGRTEVCVVGSGGMQSQQWIRTRELERFLERHPGSYVGDCVVTPPAPNPQPSPQVNRVGACASQPVLRDDGTVGIFLDLDAATFASGSWTSYDGVTVTFTAAAEIPGGILTCNPAGYSNSGTFDGPYPIYT